MNGSLIIYSLGFYILVITVSILFKRSLGISYDRKTLVSSTIALIFALIAGVGFGIDRIAELNPNPNDGSGWAVKFLALGTIVFLTNAIVQFVFWMLFAMIRYRNWAKLPRFLFNIFAILIVIFTTLYSYSYIFDQNLDGLLVTSTVVSAVIGLALQSTLSNLFSGFSLQVESPFSIDDWVNLGGHEGKVVSQNWRSVTLLTRENHRVSITNGFVAEDKIVNFSRPTRRQINNFYITLDYTHPPNKVKKVLEDVLNEIEEVELDSTLGAFVVDYMDSGIKYCMRYWLYDYAEILQLRDVVLTRVWYALSREGIKIPYPISEIQMHTIPGPGGEKNTIDNPYVIKFLSKLEWLDDMQNENIEKLAHESKLRLYAKDDLIVGQGNEGNSMFIVIKGSANVLVRADNNIEIEVAKKMPGEFFGEMSLLTGEPRTASVRANEDCSVLVIEKEDFSSLIVSDEKILAEFIDVLVKCKSGIAEAIEKEQQGNNVTKESAHKLIFNKIWNYLQAA